MDCMRLRLKPKLFQKCSLFSANFWDCYNDYQEVHRHAKELLREKSALDEDFVAFCVQRKGAAKHSLQHIIDLPVQRLSQYETYFQDFLNETRPEHGRGAEYHDLCMVTSAVKQTIKRVHEQSDLERIQDVFPNDFLRLYDKEALTMKMKGLIRKRGGTGTAALRRALSSKSLRSESPPSTPNKIRNESPRKFIMETPVQFVNGVHCQERHLFLFDDLLLVAKAKSGSNFKLKDKVRISEIWLNESPAVIDEVAEIPKSSDTSFVIGWPTTNYVAVFSTQATRNLWWSKLTEESQEEIRKEPPTTNVQVFYQDLTTGIEYCKTFAIGPDESARDCVKIALDHLEMRDADPSQYQLWAKTPREEPPYPLFGHEKPYSVKLSCLRDGISAEEGFDLDHCNNVHDNPLARCHFILRSVKAQENETNKKTPKKSSGRMKIGQVFKKTPTKENGGNLFGVPLNRICDGENLPKPVMAMLHQIFSKGPFTQGIFRKSANARLVRELREKMDICEDVCLENVPVLVTAALFKDMLRSLPDPLLCTNLFPKWRSALDSPNLHMKLFRIKMIIDQLPKPNYLLLCHFLCVLYHISRRSTHNLMSAANLGVCVGPSLLWSDSPAMCPTEDLRTVPALVEILIAHCELLCGPHVPNLLGDPRDSGTEESDSMRRDDSSIDSLEVSPPPRKDQISLSRDSGLTLSDSQLYTPDEEESGSTSSSGYDPAFDQAHSTKAVPQPPPPVTPTTTPTTPTTAAVAVPTMTGDYVRVYPGWEDRKNVSFQRQAWFRQRSKRLTATASKEAVRRSASEESVLDGGNVPPPPTPPRRSKPATAAVVQTNSGNLVPAPQQDHQYRKMSAADYYNVVVVKSEVVVDSLYPNNYSTELTIKPVTAYDDDEPTPSPPPPSSTVRRPSEAVEFQSRYRHRVQTAAREDCRGDDNEEDSSTLSDEDCTPHVSRSNSRGNEVVADSLKLRQHQPSQPSSSAVQQQQQQQTPPAHVDGTVVRLRGRLKRKEEKAVVSASRSRSLPPPPPYRPPPPANRRAPITSYYLGECSQAQQQRFVVTRTYADEESYV
ncbi:rho GTPase-activating protein 20-like isoform X3 [Sipha flava]|uniref:Rho GTPase-activating protein 20-like isoform X3 n=1 Tax=Sipha flava TaxID=143950 RepID=A0A8B8FTH7_9HEMI|nr:rho GTPase-activating protein 20-like isoform X3 [Sipha flava]